MANFSFIKKALPWIGTALQAALPGPVGNVAKILTDKLGKPVPATASGLSELVEQLMGDPAQFGALRDAENQFKQAMTQMGYAHEEEIEEVAAADRASARTMQIATRSWIPGTLAMAVTTGFFGLLLLIALRAVPTASEKVLDVMTGALGTAWITVVTYYFGSSAHSERTADILADVGPNGKGK